MAKKLNNYRRTVQYLQKIYNLINQEYFHNELEEITLTVQESVRSYGHVSVSDTWFTDDKAMKELNISANYLRRDITEIVTTLIHECSHIWNMQHDIKDTRNGIFVGTMHTDRGNNRFLYQERLRRYPDRQTGQFFIRWILRRDKRKWKQHTNSPQDEKAIKHKEIYLPMLRELIQSHKRYQCDVYGLRRTVCS